MALRKLQPGNEPFIKLQKGLSGEDTTKESESGGQKDQKQALNTPKKEMGEGERGFIFSLFFKKKITKKY